MPAPVVPASAEAVILELRRVGVTANLKAIVAEKEEVIYGCQAEKPATKKPKLLGKEPAPKKVVVEEDEAEDVEEESAAKKLKLLGKGKDDKKASASISPKAKKAVVEHKAELGKGQDGKSASASISPKAKKAVVEHKAEKKQEEAKPVKKTSPKKPDGNGKDGKSSSSKQKPKEVELKCDDDEEEDDEEGEEEEEQDDVSEDEAAVDENSACAKKMSPKTAAVAVAKSKG